MEENNDKTLEAMIACMNEIERDVIDEAFDETATAKNEFEKKDDLNSKAFPPPSFLRSFYSWADGMYSQHWCFDCEIPRGTRRRSPGLWIYRHPVYKHPNITQ